MRYRTAYITLSGKFKNKNFQKKEDMEQYLFDRLDNIRRVRCIDKKTKDSWSLQA